MDSFTYKANDGELDSNLARVNINITPVNDAPVAYGMEFITLEDNQLLFYVRTSVSDVDSTVFTVTSVHPKSGDQMDFYDVTTWLY